MNRSEQSARVKAVRAYLDGIGTPISAVQGYEVLARSLGLRSKHVLAAQGEAALAAVPATKVVPASIAIGDATVPVMALTDEPYSVARMRELAWKFDVIVPFSLDQLESVDMMNDYASQRVTGSDAALEAIGYDHVPDVNYGKGWVAYRVTGYVSAPEDLFEEEESEAQDAQFYADLLELADRIKGNVEVTVVDKGHASAQVLWRISAEPRQLLQEYARTQGATSAAVNRHGDDTLFEARGRDGAADLLVMTVRLSDLKYAHKIAPDTFEFDFWGRLVTLRFDS